ncbi:hypothetical protein C0J52_00225 [Blattella germanica]|nr:hypothetical protein C0J52_00225 [Blattella germanica]
MVTLEIRKCEQVRPYKRQRARTCFSAHPNMKLLVCIVLIAFASAKDTTAEKDKSAEDPKSTASGNKPKRGLFGLGYGYSHGFDHSLDFGYGEAFDHFNYGLGHDLHHHEPVKTITITKKVPYAVPQPYPVEVIKKVPVPVKVAVPVHVPRPYPVHVPKPYPVVIEKKVPYTVEKPVPVPVHVPVKVPVPQPVAVEVPQPYPVAVEKPVAVPVEKPVVVETPVFIHDYHHNHYPIGLDEY